MSTNGPFFSSKNVNNNQRRSKIIERTGPKALALFSINQSINQSLTSVSLSIDSIGDGRRTKDNRD